MTQKKLTKHQALVITGFTGKVAIAFPMFHEDVEKRLGHPVFTNEFPELKDKIKEAYREDFLAMVYKGDE